MTRLIYRHDTAFSMVFRKSLKITDELKLYICGNEIQNTRFCKHLGIFTRSKHLLSEAVHKRCTVVRSMQESIAKREILPLYNRNP